MDPAVPIMSLLAVAASAFVLWESLAPSASKPLATYVALVILASAFALSSQAVPLFASIFGKLRPRTRLQYVTGGCFLGLVAIAILHDRMLHPQNSSDITSTHASYLMAASGGMLALWSPSLMGLTVGVGLYAVARRAAWQEERYTVKALMGPFSILLGAVLLYNGTATIDMAALGRFLWEHGEPQSFGLYLGLGLVLAGIALCTGFLPPFGAFARRSDSPVSHLLGLLLLLRLGLYLGALAREWFWFCLLLSLACLAWGWTTALTETRGDPLRRIWRLLGAQRGFLLLALAFIFRGQDLALLVTVAVAYVLVQGVARLSLRWLSEAGAVDPGQLLSSAVLGAPMIGVPLCVGLLSLMGLPPTLGFIVRAELVRLAWTESLRWLVPCVAAMSIVCLWVLAPLMLSLLRREGTPIGSSPPWTLRVTLALAAVALLALGLFPLPLVQLARWLGGG